METHGDLSVSDAGCTGFMCLGEESNCKRLCSCRSDLGGMGRKLHTETPRNSPLWVFEGFPKLGVPFRVSISGFIWGSPYLGKVSFVYTSRFLKNMPFREASKFSKAVGMRSPLAST